MYWVILGKNSYSDFKFVFYIIDLNLIKLIGMFILLKIVKNLNDGNSNFGKIIYVYINIFL